MAHLARQDDHAPVLVGLGKLAEAGNALLLRITHYDVPSFRVCSRKFGTAFRCQPRVLVGFQPLAQFCTHPRCLIEQSQNVLERFNIFPEPFGHHHREGIIRDIQVHIRAVPSSQIPRQVEQADVCAVLPVSAHPDFLVLDEKQIKSHLDVIFRRIRCKSHSLSTPFHSHLLPFRHPAQGQSLLQIEHPTHARQQFSSTSTFLQCRQNPLIVFISVAFSFSSRSISSAAEPSKVS